ncbi:hypothetical protein VOLCADRAFT_104535 [Volvox carteri f. nagariensis]|uniref:Allene-oxide cyclase n=1 Tax=Volvox carteri f. nagariensis TaxID=3068 RepID=D8TU97_VOLCA|nr:uncharacterized protein VOLCADRAFT_104535 [Volvox carteri f. nagariensis]EFJ49000.1 hypothetical protein VOLCADRAFT_104535 [Volvox carteri f. nagariensis]|eukprot:XP_002949897.1 hypothetical protein VOLCADRAFT_104535 [Volvox carteri f. nagariensis]
MSVTFLSTSSCSINTLAPLHFHIITPYCPLGHLHIHTCREQQIDMSRHSSSGSNTTLLALAALLLLSAGPVFGGGKEHDREKPQHKPPPKPPKEICDKILVVTEKFNETAWVTPAGIKIGSSRTGYSYSLGSADNVVPAARDRVYRVMSVTFLSTSSCSINTLAPLHFHIITPYCPLGHLHIHTCREQQIDMSRHSSSGSNTTLLALAALLLLSAGPVFGGGKEHDREKPQHKPPPKPPKEICDKILVVTEKFNETAWVTPAGIKIGSDLSRVIGYSLGYRDPLYLGACVTPKTKIGMVSAFCYQFDLRYSYCVNTLEIGIFGTITFLGPFTDVQDAYFENAVTGGTGIYRGAEGVVKVKVLKQGEVYAYKIVLEDEPKCYDK